jgi:Uma2 family endonuclease
MSASTVDYLEAIEHLPDGAMLRLEDISWDEYEQLLEQLTEWRGMRVSYDRGRVEIMSPSFQHEKFIAFISGMGRILAEEMDITVEAAGATTYKQESLLKGSEGDESFYVKSANAIIGKLQIDLDIDPPPDVVVEVDITNESLNKFPIYAAFLVPEIWRYDGKQARIYHLVNEDYLERDVSLSFPFLTAQAMTEFLDQSKTQGQTAVLAAFRQWVRAAMQAPPSSD